MDEEIRKKITRARAQLIMHKPFFGYLACYLEPKEDKNLPFKSMGTDGKNLYYDPEYVRILDMEQLQAVIAHEVYHAAFSHIWRRGARDTIRWNLAADVITNTMLLAEGFKLPSGGLMIDAPHDVIEKARKLSVEEAYEKIKVEKQKGGGQGKGGKGTITLPSKGDTDLDGELLDDHDVWDKAGDGGKSEVEKSQTKKEIEQRWREYVSRARQIVKSQGKGMGNMDELIDELLEPKMKWREFLRNFLLSSVISDYQLCPPSKRHLWRGIYLPSTKKEEEVDVIFVVDTSGSMSTDEVRDGLSEVKGICEEFGGFRIWYVECDWDIHRITELTPYTYNLDEIKKVRGRGGTRFPVQSIVSKVRDEHNGNPSAIIYFTDSFGDVAGDDPGLPVFWLVCQENERFKPGFGTVVTYTRKT
jgi:predicted metal-dependent peptidase